MTPKRTLALTAASLLSLAALTTSGCSGEPGTDITEEALTGEVTLFGKVKPAETTSADSSAVELGVRFEAGSAGAVHGIRFYKGAGNSGTHLGHLWSNTGTLLATAIFSGESASGWQRALFSKPVTLQPGALYVASYFAPRGHYAADPGYFASTGHARGPLTAPRDGERGANAVYHYGTAAFPTDTWQSANYYVDVVFVAAGTTPPPPVDAGTPPPPVDAGTPPPVDAGTPPPVDAGTPPSGGKNCAPNPHLCGYPDATNTGVPAGVTLKKVPSQVDSGKGWHWDYTYGFIRADEAGAVVEGLDVPGEISVMAANVTVKNCRVISSGESSMGVSVRPGADNAIIEDVTLSGVDAASGRLMVGVKVWGAKNVTIQRVNVSWVSTGLQTDEGTVVDSYVHDMGYRSGDHINGFTSNAGGTGLVIRHNTLFNAISQTDAISLFEDFGGQFNATVDNNLIGGGGYTLYAGANTGGTGTHDIKITNNRVSRLYFPNGGFYGPVTAFEPGGPRNVWSGNVWDDTGAVLSP